jgi:hypothetical protein
LIVETLKQRLPHEGEFCAPAACYGGIELHAQVRRPGGIEASNPKLYQQNACYSYLSLLCRQDARKPVQRRTGTTSRTARTRGVLPISSNRDADSMEYPNKFIFNRA